MDAVFSCHTDAWFMFTESKLQDWEAIIVEVGSLGMVEDIGIT